MFTENDERWTRWEVVLILRYYVILHFPRSNRYFHIQYRCHQWSNIFLLEQYHSFLCLNKASCIQNNEIKRNTWRCHYQKIINCTIMLNCGQLYIYSHDVISNRFFDLSCFPWFPDSRQKVCQSSFILGVSYKSIFFNLTSVHLSLVNNDRGEFFLSLNNRTITG